MGRVKRNPLMNPGFVPRLPAGTRNPKRMVRDLVLRALHNGTSVKTQVVSRKLRGGEEFEKFSKKAREEISIRIETTKALLDNMKQGIRRDEKPPSPAELENFSR